MAFFAVVRKSLDDDFKVAECHLNLWCLPGLFKKVFLFDVGLRLEALPKPISEIELALPFGIDHNQTADLYDAVVDTRTAPLIFGSQVNIEDSSIKYTSSRFGNISLKVIHITKSQVTIDDKLTGEAYTYCSVKFPNPVGAEGNANTYLRFRFRVVNTGRVWTWKRRKNGALVDFRVADLRESVLIEDWKVFENRIADIGHLNLFIIAPISLEFHSASPEYHYVRLLEGQAWERYTKRKAGLRSHNRLMTYQWRNSPKLPEAQDTAPELVTSSKPFRVSLALKPELEPIKWRDYIITALLVLIPVLVVYGPIRFVNRLDTVSMNLLALIWDHIVPLSALVSLGGAIKVIQMTKWFPWVRAEIKSAYQFIDAKLYGRG